MCWGGDTCLGEETDVKIFWKVNVCLGSDRCLGRYTCLGRHTCLGDINSVFVPNSSEQQFFHSPFVNSGVSFILVFVRKITDRKPKRKG